MKILNYVPKGLIEIKERYGWPDINDDMILDRWFVINRLKLFKLPFPMRLSWKPEKKIYWIQCHIDIGIIIIDALTEINEKVGFKYLDKNKLNYYGGCFNFRLKRNGSGMSVHSLGIAIDLNPHIAPYGEKGKQPEYIVEAFVKRGFKWGGDWDFPDPMHFQACEGY